MLKKLLTVVLPLALPFIVYFGYLALARRRARQAGGTPSPWADAPWPAIALAGLLLMAGVLVGVRIFGEQAQPGAKIVPDRYIDGEIEPSRVVE